MARSRWAEAPECGYYTTHKSELAYCALSDLRKCVILEEDAVPKHFNEQIIVVRTSQLSNCRIRVTLLHKRKAAFLRDFTLIGDRILIDITLLSIDNSSRTPAAIVH